jgi:hypothetical protein
MGYVPSEEIWFGLPSMHKLGTLVKRANEPDGSRIRR